ncbi:hypothetical protein AAFF_G00148130 [Aldrovandia affinis]|uniref:Uncharacterized protein n=1 Tax=Aldrovandia affinis TaxID=143900 RepID=A0AAD7RPR2_9TELE|nr:hypothetical protein AAFF_G00148130 [Aldrovandia affinis]
MTPKQILHIIQTMGLKEMRRTPSSGQRALLYQTLLSLGWGWEQGQAQERGWSRRAVIPWRQWQLAGRTTSESNDEVLCATANRTPSAVLAPAGRGGARVKRGHRYIEDKDPSDSDSDSSPVPPPRIRERSPNRTRSSKSARIAILKTMTAANGNETTVSRPLTCDECASHKSIVGELLRKGPFEPYWNRLMLQTAAFKLERRDVWQIVLITLPSELMHRATAPLLSGTIVDPVSGEMDAEVYEHLNPPVVLRSK